MKEEESKKELKKVGEFLYSAEYTKLDYNKANKWIREHYGVPSLCTAIRNGNWIVRNLDWYYNYEANVYVKVNKTKDHFASHGIVSSVSQLTIDKIESGDIKEIYDVIPFLISEGINEYGLHVATNVVYLEPNMIPTSGTRPIISLKENVCMSSLTRYILDKFKTPIEAISYIKNYVSVYANSKLSDLGLEAHFIISDNNDSYIMEFINNEIKVIKENKMTNFYLYGVEFNQDGKVYTPATQDSTHNAVDTNKIGLLGMGLERWNLVIEKYLECNTKEKMLNLGLNVLDYERSYTIEKPENIWYTEFVGENSRGFLTTKSNISDYEYVIGVSREMYKHRDRTQDKNGVWCTAHTSVYDISTKTLYIHITNYDKTKEYEFKL